MKITCANGHVFNRTSNCRVCPKCFSEEHQDNSFLQHFSAPAQRALLKEGITSIDKLKSYSTAELGKLHGIGPSTLLKFKELING